MRTSGFASVTGLDVVIFTTFTTIDFFVIPLAAACRFWLLFALVLEICHEIPSFHWILQWQQQQCRAACLINRCPADFAHPTVGRITDCAVCVNFTHAGVK
jgi:hypothetical protein